MWTWLDQSWLLAITSQRGSTWHRYILDHWLCRGKRAFFYLYRRKPIENIQRNFIIHDHVDNSYKIAKLGQDWLTGITSTPLVKCNGFVAFVLLFTVPSSCLQVAILIRFTRFMAQMVCFVRKCLLGVCSLRIHFQGVFDPKNFKFLIRFWTSPIRIGDRYSIKDLESKLPLNLKATSRKIDFRLEVPNQESIFHTGGSVDET